MKDNGGLEHLADARAIALGMDIELQLEKTKKAGFQPVLWLLVKARKRAAAAMVQLAIVDPKDEVAIRGLQNELALFDNMVSDCREAIDRGREIDGKIAEEDRLEINNMILATQNLTQAERLGATELNDR